MLLAAERVFCCIKLYLKEYVARYIDDEFKIINSFIV